MTAASWIDEYLVELERVGFTNSRQACKWMLQQITSAETVDLSSCRLDADQKRVFCGMHARLVRGEPLQYVLGETEFYNCTIQVGPGVLIPRPETELLVDLALKHCSGRGDILDLCTGSGCIPLAMAIERPEIPCLVGVDISEDALKWANLNRERLKVPAVEFKKSDLFDGLEGQTFELITANPPYVRRDEYASLSDTVKCHEPELALFAENDGLDVLRRIIRGAPEYLIADGWLMCEIGCEQGESVSKEFETNGFVQVQVHKDYAGLDRIVSGQRPI